MARPIEPTPILRDEDAKNFLKDLEETKPNPAVYEQLEQCQRLYEVFQSKVTSRENRPT